MTKEQRIEAWLVEQFNISNRNMIIAAEASIDSHVLMYMNQKYAYGKTLDFIKELTEAKEIMEAE